MCYLKKDVFVFLRKYGKPLYEKCFHKPCFHFKLWIFVYKTAGKLNKVVYLLLIDLATISEE